jgi:hypothetical protein
MKIWIYQPRNAPAEVYYNFTDARNQQDKDNGMTLEEADQQHFDHGGSEAEGWFYIDDGGSMELVEIQ